MSRRSTLVLGALLAAALTLPTSSWASGGTLPSAARSALYSTVRSNVPIARVYGAKLRTKRHSQSKGLESTRWVSVQAESGHSSYQKGRAYIYNAKIELPGGVEQNAGKYLLVERQNHQSGDVYWEVRALAKPLTNAGKVSKQTTKRVTRPASGEGELKAAFINEGQLPLYKSATGMTVKGATVVHPNYFVDQRAEVLAERVDRDKKTITYFALGREAGNKAVTETTVLGEEPPLFMQPAGGPAASLAPPDGPGQRPPHRPEWQPVPVKAETAQIEASPLSR